MSDANGSRRGFHERIESHAPRPPLGRPWVLAGIAAAVVLTLAVLGYFAARLEVVVEPADARERASVRVVRGFGFDFGATVFAAPGPLTLLVEAPGYDPAEIEVGEGARRRGRVDAILRAGTTAVRAFADPPLPDVEWRVDGRSVAAGKTFEIEVEPGEHVISAIHPHRIPASASITAVAGRTLEGTLVLAPVDGGIEIASEPSGARVSVNGEAKGATPLDVEAAGGVHELRIEYEGREPLIDIVEITYEAPMVARAYTLRRLEAKAAFTLEPPGGVLTVGSRAVDAARAARGIPLAAGIAHTVRYTLPGHEPGNAELTLDPGESRAVAFRLAPRLGVVEVRAEPQAEVEVGGKPAGTTPLPLELLAVPQEIRLSRPGYLAVTRTLTPDPEAPRTIDVSFVRQAAARRAATPAEYTNDVGITLKLFPGPATVRMGSRRGEAGRRANEFLREVRLARAFYVGVHEVTVEQYARFAHPDEAPPADKRPVTEVGWGEAAQFCNWLSEREELTPVYRFVDGRHAGSDSRADGYRLPTEAEWAWLARKAGRSRATVFPWGGKPIVPENAGNLADKSADGAVPEILPRYDDGFPGLADVGSFPAGKAGLHDLVGNASEWVHDTHRLIPPIEGRIENDVLDTGVDRRHTVRGSSFRSASLTELRGAWRDGVSGSEDDIGFRVARYVVGEP